jgi:hypothetical protein
MNQEGFIIRERPFPVKIKKGTLRRTRRIERLLKSFRGNNEKDTDASPHETGRNG